MINDVNILYNKLKIYSLSDVIELENSDRQFLTLKILYKNKIFDNDIYLFLIIANALVCYQLSGTGEEYWEEFGKAMGNENIENFEDVKEFFIEFLPKSKNNKRFVNIKLKRIKKLQKFCQGNQVTRPSDLVTIDWEYYYKNMEILAQDLASMMGQKITDKTIVFAVKIFGYASRNVYEYVEYYPRTLVLPIDSRLEKIYKKYNKTTKVSKIEIQNYYLKLAQQLNISPLHLDSLLWINYYNLNR